MKLIVFQRSPSLQAALQFERYRPLIEASRFNVDEGAHINAVAAGVEDNLDSLMSEAKERMVKGKPRDSFF